MKNIRVNIATSMLRAENPGQTRETHQFVSRMLQNHDDRLLSAAPDPRSQESSCTIDKADTLSGKQRLDKDRRTLQRRLDLRNRLERIKNPLVLYKPCS